MKLRSYAPALVAVVGIVAVYLYATRERSPEPAAATTAHDRHDTHDPHAHEHGAQQPPPSLPPAQPDGSAAGPTAPPRLRTAAELGLEEPKAKKPKLTLDEKLAETTKHVGVIEKRAELLEREIAELERTGKQKEAAEQRVVLKRLREHAEKLRADVAARRVPE